MMKRNSQSGFGMVQVLIVTAAFAGLMVFVVSSLDQVRKKTTGLVGSDELESLVTEITLALRSDRSVCMQMIHPGYNPNANLPISISYPGGEPLVDQASAFPTFRVKSVTLTRRIRQTGGSSLSEIQIQAERKNTAGAITSYGAPLFKAIPIYFGGGQCVATRYFNAASQITFEDNLCQMVWTDPFSHTPVGGHFDYWPPAASGFCH